MFGCCCYGKLFVLFLYPKNISFIQTYVMYIIILMIDDINNGDEYKRRIIYMYIRTIQDCWALLVIELREFFFKYNFLWVVVFSFVGFQ